MNQPADGQLIGLARNRLLDAQHTAPDQRHGQALIPRVIYGAGDEFLRVA